MALAQREQPFSFTLIIAGFVATLVGYASSAAIVFQAAEAAGATRWAWRWASARLACRYGIVSRF